MTEYDDDIIETAAETWKLLPEDMSDPEGDIRTIAATLQAERDRCALVATMYGDKYKQRLPASERYGRGEAACNGKIAAAGDIRRMIIDPSEELDDD